MTNATPPPAFKAERYYIHHGDPEAPVTYEARFLWGDNLRAEMEANKRGVRPQAQPMLYLTLTAWCHAVRTGLTTDKYDEWVAGVLDIEPADKRDRKEGRDSEPEPDPT